MSTGIMYRQHDGTGREVAYYSTVLGNPAQIMNPVGAPKPRDELTPFTWALSTGDARRGPDVKAQEAFVSKLAKFGPCCNRCRKKGKNCIDSKSEKVRYACKVRQIGGPRGV